MRTHTKTTITTLLTTITLAITLALATTTANARSFETSEKELEILFPRLNFEAAGNNIACPFTILGHFFERTIPKTATQVGLVKHVEPSQGPRPPCTGGEITILNETLPWKLNYVSFRGRLPNITSIRVSIIGIALKVIGSFGACLTGTTALKPSAGELLINSEAGAGRGGITGLRSDETVGIPLSGGALCVLAGESHYSGTATVLNLPRNASITVRLI